MSAGTARACSLGPPDDIGLIRPSGAAVPACNKHISWAAPHGGSRSSGRTWERKRRRIIVRKLQAQIATIVIRIDAYGIVAVDRRRVGDAVVVSIVIV
jgi:hypothetical protein